MKKTGAEILWECLIREGVEVAFGYPGGAIMPVHDAMLKYPVHHVLTRHEQGAAHAADGYARASGKVHDMLTGALLWTTWSQVLPQPCWIHHPLSVLLARSLHP